MTPPSWAREALRFYKTPRHHRVTPPYWAREALRFRKTPRHRRVTPPYWILSCSRGTPRHCRVTPPYWPKNTLVALACCNLSRNLLLVMCLHPRESPPRFQPFPTAIRFRDWLRTAKCITSVHLVEQETNAVFCLDCFAYEREVTNRECIKYYDTAIKHYIRIGPGYFWEECRRCSVLLGEERPAEVCKACRVAINEYLSQPRTADDRPHDDPVPTIIPISYKRVQPQK